MHIIHEELLRKIKGCNRVEVSPSLDEGNICSSRNVVFPSLFIILDNGPRAMEHRQNPLEAAHLFCITLVSGTYLSRKILAQMDGIKRCRAKEGVIKKGTKQGRKRIIAAIYGVGVPVLWGHDRPPVACLRRKLQILTNSTVHYRDHIIASTTIPF
jgi:hypothetical protein